MAPTEPPLGAIVEVPPGRGVVRFCGATSFSAGRWIGIELAESNGKNDGTVQGVKYFTCKPNYGVFVRPSQVKVVSLESTPSPSASRALAHERTSSTSAPRIPPSRSHLSSSTRGGPSSPGSVSPSPSSSSILTSPRQARLASSAKRKASISLQTRTSLQRQASLQSDAGGNSTGSPVMARQRSGESQEGLTRLSPRTLAPPSVSTSPRSPSQAQAQTHFQQSTPPLPSLLRRVGSPQLDFDSPVVVREPTEPTDSRPPSPVRVQDDQELQELRAKVRVLEAKRADDARHVRELETRLSEAESFVALRPKLQAKLNSQQTELIATRRELADAQQLAQLAESRILDTQEQLEMVMLDKEMAEERAEMAEADLEEVRERLAVVEVELQVLREGGGGDEGGDSSIKQSLAYIQLERQNERLKEALVRLRDISQENDQEQRRRIVEMEKDVANLDDVQAQLEETLFKLANAEVQVEELKLQLDDALGAEEMLVQLTERNLMLGEKIEEMRITIEDLEALKELNDEIEENHIDTEKAMQEEIDGKDMLIRDQAAKIVALEEACQDLESTIMQFRELVVQLQSDLDTLRTETQTSQHQAATAASQTAAMMSLNLKLQSSASKNQARYIDLEVKRIEAKEAKELLAIIQPYLPQIYVESDTDATNCYLFFQRLAAKVDLINTVVAQTHNLPESLNGPVSDVLVGVCEMRGRLSSLSTTCKRFTAFLRRCDGESFLNIGRVFPEIAPIEKRIDMHIELLRREEFRELECVSDAAKIQSQFDHLVETYLNGFEYDLGERELGFALSFDHDLEMFAASAGLVKTSVAAIMKDEDVEVISGGLDADQEFFDPLQKLLGQCRSAKVLSKKLTKRLEDLTEDSAALKAHLVPQLQSLNNVVPELVNFGISLAQQIMPHLSDVRSAKAPFQLSSVLSFVKQTAASTVGKGKKDDVSPWDTVTNFFTQMVQEATSLLPLALESENTLKITGTAPWVARIDEIRAATAINAEAERKVAQLNDEMQALARTLRTKDQNIQEATVKIELMERRMEAVKKQADTIVDLEAELNKSRKQERAYEEAMEQLQADLYALEQDNAKLKMLTSSQEKQLPGNQATEPENVQVEGSLETSYLLEQIDALRNTVRFLRTENSYLKGQDLLKELESLPPLPEPMPREPTPPLVPSTLSDSEDSDSDESTTPPNLRTLAAESKLLYREVIKYTSSPRVVDLSVMRSKRSEGDKGGKHWMPKRRTPAYQVWERKMEGERLGRKLQHLRERTSVLAAR
ncbi:dynactin [Laetiporus sulphureus 93-53]|uniref:Dynactin n=1 Tax=Laetiporus sulphureus 93-53 TaxID=1314785 RepID=A0A165C2I1_9APHY|nr:dynactin [Laetiporus sulphureus 93-53]KZT02085.1 dynactin [Laetiporus sulphureus 93-53]